MHWQIDRCGLILTCIYYYIYLDNLYKCIEGLRLFKAKPSNGVRFKRKYNMIEMSAHLT